MQLLLDLVWDSDAPSPAAIVDVLSSISTTLVLDRVFNGGASPRRYHLKGMICYYGTLTARSPASFCERSYHVLIASLHPPQANTMTPTSTILNAADG